MFVAKVKPKNERRVQGYLGRYGVEVYAPEIVVVKRGKQRIESLFPGYLFVSITPASKEWPIARWAPGLSYFLPNQNDPWPVADSLVKEIETRVEHWNAGGWTAAFQPGDRVLIESDPLRTLDGIFQRYVTGRERCEVLVSLIGRPQKVMVKVTDISCGVARQRFASLSD